LHARSVAAAAIDGMTGELVEARLALSQEAVTAWLAGLPGPVAVVYEAGPTGFALGGQHEHGEVRSMGETAQAPIRTLAGALSRAGRPDTSSPTLVHSLNTGASPRMSDRPGSGICRITHESA
jgi:hypothetical protein